MAGNALRYNEGKPKWHLVHFESLEPMVRVLEEGAKKYAPFNWMKHFELDDLMDSLMRHVAAINKGELVDKESGQLHMGHIMCNAMFWVYHYNKLSGATRVNSEKLAEQHDKDVITLNGIPIEMNTTKL